MLKYEAPFAPVDIGAISDIGPEPPEAWFIVDVTVAVM